MFRNKLSHIKNEDELFEYFKEHAGYSDSMRCYTVAGIVADDTAVLLKKLKEEWKQDCANDAEKFKLDLDKQIEACQLEIDKLEEDEKFVKGKQQELFVRMGELMTERSELE